MLFSLQNNKFVPYVQKAHLYKLQCSQFQLWDAQIFYSFIAQILAPQIFQALTVTEIHANNFLKYAQSEIYLA